MQLDDRLIELLPLLYRKEARVRKEKRKNEKEREAYTFEFHFDESVSDPAKQREMAQICSQSDGALQKLAEEQRLSSSEERGLCNTFQTIMLGLDHLTSESAVNRQMGRTWLVALLDAENHHTRSFPPTKKLLWEGIERAGAAFVTGEEMPLLLDHMLQDRGRVPLLSSLFDPCKRMFSIVQLYASVWEALPRIMPQEVLPVLEKFDFERWILTHPPYKERKRLLLMVGGVLKNLGWEQQTEAKPVMAFHVQVRG